MSAVHFASLDPTIDTIVGHLVDGHDTAFISAPGCGTTTALIRVRKILQSSGMESFLLDFKSPASADRAQKTLGTIPQPLSATRRALIVDHAAKLVPGDFKIWLERIMLTARRLQIPVLWAGPLDSRAIESEFGIGLHSMPTAHVSFPQLAQDELLAAYKAIGEEKGCRWGEAILFLLLDFCGNDLVLVHGVREYLRGDWTNRLYDDSIWDLLQQWLKRDETVNAYRERLRKIAPGCESYLILLRSGAKPLCPRSDFFQEIDAARRWLFLKGILVPNLLPGFYQFRNLCVRLLVYEPQQPWNQYGPSVLFRRATNERVGQLLQDVESMLRCLLTEVFHRIGADRVARLLEGKQSDRELLPSSLNKALLDWAEQTSGREVKAELNKLLVEHREAFKAANSVWAKVGRMMSGDVGTASVDPLPAHVRCIDYLTFNELAVVTIDLFDDIFPKAPADGGRKAVLRDRWRDSMSIVQDNEEGDTHDPTQ